MVKITYYDKIVIKNKTYICRGGDNLCYAPHYLWSWRNGFLRMSTAFCKLWAFSVLDRTTWWGLM